MQNVLVNVNGQILSPNEAKTSVFDRGFLYGDSLYEVMRSYHGKFFMLDEHMKRLETSARLCKMKLDQNLDHYKNEIYRTLHAFKKIPGLEKSEAYCRIIVTRGVGKIGFGLNCVQTPTQYFIIVQPIEPPTEQEYQKGAALQVATRIRNDSRALDPAMKSGNYLNSLLAYLEATEAGFNDALLCNGEGHLTEGTTFNIFYVRRGIIATPPLDVGILDGITRRFVIDVARENSVPVREVRFPPERLYDADEVFLTSTIREVFPVTRVNKKIIGDGKPGPITLKLQKAYRASIA